MLKIEWPKIRNTFIPDPGWVWFDIDLAGADAQVVAWEAGDEDLKAAFRAKVKIHVKNGSDIWSRELMYSRDPKGKTEPYYTRIKRGVHLTNYGGQVPTLAKKCAMSYSEAERFQAKWFELHPAIVAWHERTMFEIQTLGRTSNKMGWSIDWFTRPTLDVWRRALAWTPQSTVAAVAEEAMIRIYEERQVNPYFSRKYIRLALQVHDSLDFIVKLEYVPAVLPRIYDILHSIIVPYDDPLIIPWGIKRGRTSWGECTEIEWDELLNAEGKQGLVDCLSGVHGRHGGASELPPVDRAGNSSGSGPAENLDRPSPLPVGAEPIRPLGWRARNRDQVD